MLSPDQEINDEGYVLPKVEVSDVAFTLHPDMFIVNAHGDLPLYKSTKFEKGIKKWMNERILNLEKEFKIAMQQSERQIMSSFGFKKEMVQMTAHSTLSETMSLDGDHVTIAYDTKFGGQDISKMKQKMRHLNPKFTNEPDFVRDLQVIVDENYINYHLFMMFNTERIYSMNELLF